MTFSPDLNQAEVKQHMDYQGVKECKERLRNHNLALDNLADPISVDQDTSDGSDDLNFLAPGLGESEGLRVVVEHHAVLRT